MIIRDLNTKNHGTNPSYCCSFFSSHDSFNITNIQGKSNLRLQRNNNFKEKKDPTLNSLLSLSLINLIRLNEIEHNLFNRLNETEERIEKRSERLRDTMMERKVGV